MSYTRKNKHDVSSDRIQQYLNLFGQIKDDGRNSYKNPKSQKLEQTLEQLRVASFSALKNLDFQIILLCSQNNEGTLYL